MTGESHYERKKQALECELVSVHPDDIYSPHRWSYLMTCSARHHLLPERAGDEANFYREVLFCQQLAVLDRGLLPEISGRIHYRGCLDFLEDAGRQPFIFCSFHLGSFHAIAYVLAKYGVDVSVVVNRQAGRNLSAQVRHDMDHLCSEMNYRFNMELLDGESPNAALGLIRRLKAGRNLLVYLDGNAGSGESLHAPGFITADFLDGRLYVRRGIAGISHKLGVPIVPVISYRDKQQSIQLEFLNPLYPGNNMDSEEYSMWATRKLYALLSGYVRQYPGQWEGWLYTSHLIDKIVLRSRSNKLPSGNAPERGSCHFNKSRYGLLANGKNYYLFDKYKQQMLQIGPGLFGMLYHEEMPGSGKINSTDKELIRVLTDCEIFME